MKGKRFTQLNSGRKVVVLLLCALFILSLSFIFWKASHRESLYEGKPFGYWVDQLPLTFTLTNQGSGSTRIYRGEVFYTADKGNPELRKQALGAVHAIGPEKLPMLVKLLGSRQGTLQDNLVLWVLRKRWLKPDRVQPAVVKRGKALTALVELGPRAAPIVPELVRLAGDPDPRVQEAAMYALLKVDQTRARELLEASGTNVLVRGYRF